LRLLQVCSSISCKKRGTPSVTSTREPAPAATSPTTEMAQRHLQRTYRELGARTLAHPG
jgi:hypothetical protein